MAPTGVMDDAEQVGRVSLQRSTSICQRQYLDWGGKRQAGHVRVVREDQGVPRAQPPLPGPVQCRLQLRVRVAVRVQPGSAPDVPMVRAVMVRLPPQGAYGEEALAEGHGAEEAVAQPPRHDVLCFFFWAVAISSDRTARLWLEKKIISGPRAGPIQGRRRRTKNVISLPLKNRLLISIEGFV